jgi:hypothetical protein
VPTATIKIKDSEFKALLDSGAEGSLFVSETVARENGIAKGQVIQVTAIAQTLHAWLATEAVRVTSPAGETKELVTIVLPDARVTRRLVLLGSTGLVELRMLDTLVAELKKLIPTQRRLQFAGTPEAPSSPPAVQSVLVNAAAAAQPTSPPPAPVSESDALKETLRAKYHSGTFGTIKDAVMTINFDGHAPAHTPAALNRPSNPADQLLYREFITENLRSGILRVVKRPGRYHAHLPALRAKEERSR